jgi:hypothetical protein
MRMNSKQMTERMWSVIETPTHFVTVKPMTPGITVVDVASILDTTNYQLLRQAFGKNWKRKRRFPKWCLQPERESHKSRGGSYDFLHYHGIVQLESKQLEWWYQNHFTYLFAQNINEYREEGQTRFGYAEVEFEKYDHSKDARGYALKHHSMEFDHEDAYVFGRDSKIRD